VATFGISNGVKIEHRDLPVLIYGNGLLAIDLGFDGVTEEGRPVLTVADVSNGFARVIGDVRSTPNTSVDLNIFASDALTPLRTADAKTALYAAKVNTDAAGLASFEFRFLPRNDVTGQWISATATTMAGTSELSAPLQAVANNQNFTVLNTEDSGAGSLRQAILDANAGICSADFPCRVQFDLPAPVPASGHYTIAPLTPLPAVRRSGIIVDGESTPLPFFGLQKPPLVEINGSRSTPGAGLTISSDNAPIVNVSIRRLAINGFNGPGILIDGSDNYILNPVITNNFIGTDPTGTVAVPNTGDGIRVRGDIPFVHIGTFSSGNRIQNNLISGNLGNGVMLESGFFEFQANAIGTEVTQKLPIPNGRAGVDVEATANSHLEANTVAFNGTVGISTVITTPTAFKGAIQNSIHSNAGPAIELRDAAVALAGDVARQTPPEITSATYDPATGVTTITGSFTRVTTSPDYWTTTLDFATSPFPESGGRGSMETPLYVNLMTLKDEGQRRFSFSGTARQVDLRGRRISATATPFIYEGFKAPPQNDIFGQGFVYGTTSEVSRAVPVVTLGCPADRPQITESSPGEFRWSTVAGATAYNVWVRTIPGVPHVIANTSGGSAAVSLEPGTYEWFVEAIFPQCPSTKSEAASITVKPGRKRVVAR
jgi:hypothetical protein